VLLTLEVEGIGIESIALQWVRKHAKLRTLLGSTKCLTNYY
jgi:hypothetical protein